MWDPIKLIHPLYKDIPVIDYPRLVIDGIQQLDADVFRRVYFTDYDKREPGSVQALLKAYAFMLQNTEKPLTEIFIKKLHHLALSNVRFPPGARKHPIIPGEYRKEAIQFGLSIGKNTSKNGLARIKAKHKDRLRHSIEGGYIMVAPYNTPEQISAAVNNQLNDFSEKIKVANTKDHKLKVIATLIQNLEWAHPFSDGNGRVFHILLLNKLLLQYGLIPAILELPNSFEGNTIKELISKIKEGQRNFLSVKRGAGYPGAQSTAALLKEHNDNPAIIMWATRSNQAEILGLCLQSGHNPNACEYKDFGSTPLLIAKYYDYKRCEKLLLKQGAEPNKPGPFGLTPNDFKENIAKNRVLSEKMTEFNEKFESPQAAKILYGKIETLYFSENNFSSAELKLCDTLLNRLRFELINILSLDDVIDLNRFFLKNHQMIINGENISKQLKKTLFACFAKEMLCMAEEKVEKILLFVAEQATEVARQRYPGIEAPALLMIKNQATSDYIENSKRFLLSFPGAILDGEHSDIPACKKLFDVLSRYRHDAASSKENQQPVVEQKNRHKQSTGLFSSWICGHRRVAPSSDNLVLSSSTSTRALK